MHAFASLHLHVNCILAAGVARYSFSALEEQPQKSFPSRPAPADH